MDTYRAFLAIVISFVILLGYQYLFVGFDQPDPEVIGSQASSQEQIAPQGSTIQAPLALPAATSAQPPVQYDRTPLQVEVDTPLYTATISEDGGVVTSFRLKNHKETHDADSLGMQLVKTTPEQGFPLQFSWGTAVNNSVLYDSDRQNISLVAGSSTQQLTMVAQAGNGLVIERVYTFNDTSYLVDLTITVKNQSNVLLQGTPQLNMVNSPFDGVSSPANRFLFGGPAAFVNGELQEVNPDDLEEGAQTLQGSIDWAGYEGNYFICAVLPGPDSANLYTMEGNEVLTRATLTGKLETLQPGAGKAYSYQLYYGPKKLTLLQEVGSNLDRSVNFGWFDVLAKPTLWLLNMFYNGVRNYGIAIILVTVLFKAIFWPISQKGLKSMKNMQKLQPKMVKIKEKYKGDPTKMNQEVMNLYKTYKVNPLGGCLPMVLQIPVFFALYKVLLQSIELRHAPFMLWISDLAAPDRLWIGFDIPYLGGLPVLTLLMGASMFLQQKLSPTTADPAQARIMMFLPIVFTFMFLNFASGLVLYWFVNNLLSILQQVLINRDTKKQAEA